MADQLRLIPQNEMPAIALGGAPTEPDFDKIAAQADRNTAARGGDTYSAPIGRRDRFSELSPDHEFPNHPQLEQIA